MKQTRAERRAIQKANAEQSRIAMFEWNAQMLERDQRKWTLEQAIRVHAGTGHGGDLVIATAKSFAGFLNGPEANAD